MHQYLVQIYMVDTGLMHGYLSNRRMSQQVVHTTSQSAFLVVFPEDLPLATFAKTIESVVEPLFSPAHFPAQETVSAVWTTS